MYVPPKFALSESELAAALSRAGFAHLVTHGAEGFMVTPLPLLYRSTSHTLVGHVARGNPHWRRSGGDSVAIFAGLHGYISPNFYATKAETGKVVPTWNYDVLAVHGRLMPHDDADWVRTLVTELTQHHERDSARPWQVSDAPEAFTAAQLRGIVGLELTIEHVDGKSKMSQNQPERNRLGVVDGLRNSSDVTDRLLAERIAAVDESGVGDN
jgi:transcriptional regulator